MSESKETIVYTACNSHCGGACLLKVHVKDGVVTRVETDDGEEPQFRACLRCRAFRQRLYAPDRLQYPMKRVGERGEGKFERISWDEAFSTVAKQLTRVKETYGPASIVFFCSLADIHVLHTMAPMHRLLCMSGGYTQLWGFMSYEGGVFAECATLGTNLVNSTRDDLVNSKLIIMWGWDPAVSIQRTNTPYYLAKAKEAGARIIAVDPRYTDSAATFADEWIPLYPCTDAALLIAMAYVIITENRQDQAFLDKYTIGFDRFKDYVLGIEDGIPKTPAWAEAITGAKAATIERLAREYATTRPAALIGGIAPGRTAYGEQYHRAAIILSAMTGNIGVSGGSSAARSWGGEHWGGETPFMARTRGRMSSPRNPVEEGWPARRDTVKARGANTNSSVKINVGQIAEAILKGKAGGYPADYKLLYLANTNYVNQILNTNKTIEAFKKVEFIAVQEQFMTPTARYADILMPVNTYLERNDFTTGGATPWYGLVNKAVESLHESKSHLEIASGIAAAMGLKDFNDKSEEEWVKSIVEGYREVFAKDKEGSDYETLKKKGLYKFPADKPYVAFKEQIEDLKNHPFPTASGKIEIYSQELADWGNPLLPPVPKYIEAWEGRNDPLAEKYPLQLVTSHARRRAHSQFDNLPWLRELIPQRLQLNATDALARGISTGDLVRVFNDRGQTVIAAEATQRIMPGVVNLPQGAWYAPDEKGVDRAGSANVLTRDARSPGGAFCTNTALVQVERWHRK
ncbi:MAG: molybdopterin-dependent oxidoreductase [Chloroflexi bacterium]|nr:molybdopterin-dependent oxidoreductase [Chloroflexota bacterium]